MGDDGSLPVRVGVIEARLVHIDEGSRQLWVEVRALDKSVQGLDKSLAGLAGLQASLETVTASLNRVQAQQQQWRGERRAAGTFLGLASAAAGALLMRAIDWISSGGPH